MSKNSLKFRVGKVLSQNINTGTVTYSLEAAFIDKKRAVDYTEKLNREEQHVNLYVVY